MFLLRHVAVLLSLVGHALAGVTPRQSYSTPCGGNVCQSFATIMNPIVTKKYDPNPTCAKAIQGLCKTITGAAPGCDLATRAELNRGLTDVTAALNSGVFQPGSVRTVSNTCSCPGTGTVATPAGCATVGGVNLCAANGGAGSVVISNIPLASPTCAADEVAVGGGCSTGGVAGSALQGSTTSQTGTNCIFSATQPNGGGNTPAITFTASVNCVKVKTTTFTPFVSPTCTP